MNEHNYAYVRDQLRNAGFGDTLQRELRQGMLTGKDFSFAFDKKFDKDVVSATLRFKRSAESDFFFFSNYSLRVSLKGVEPRQQIFQVKGMQGITLEQGYNLLNGSAVVKHFPEKKDTPAEFAWQQLDFSAKDSTGNYKILEFPYAFEEIMAASLKLTLFPMPSSSGVMQFHENIQNGVPHAGLFENGNKSVTLLVQYDPSTKEMVLLNKHMQRLTADERKAFVRPEEVKPDSLLPKKRVRNYKRGLSV